MPRMFKVRQEFDVPADRVRAMMVDPAYTRRRAERTGAIRVEVEIDAGDGNSVELHITRVLPTTEAPSFARRLLGDSITVVETQTWQPAVAGRATATMSASFGSMVQLVGTIDLGDSGAGAIAVTHATCTASVPLVGGKVESLVEQQVRDYLAYEQHLAREWLGAAGDHP